MLSTRQKKTLLLLTTTCFCLYIFIKSEFELLKGLNEIHYKYFYFTINVQEEWTKNQVRMCGGKFNGYGNEFARLHDVAVNVQHPGQFFLECTQNDYPYYTFNELTNKNHLNQWIESLTQMNTNIVRTVHHSTTLAVLRYEYANFFHQITDMYNAFVITKLFNINPNEMNILFFGKYNAGHIDKSWDTLFGKIERVENYNQPVLYKDLIWAVLGYNSPVNFFSLVSLPLIEEFSNFYVSNHKSSKKNLNCDTISILFIWRHDYIAHPGNPTGLIKRKISNEEEILKAVEEIFPSHHVAGIQLDQYDMMGQVQFISQTDILIGMHGAGMAHTLFLPTHAGVLELYPNYWSKFNRHFKAMAKWRKLNYLNWQNINPTNEKERFATYIPPNIIIQKLISLYYNMCHRKPDS